MRIVHALTYVSQDGSYGGPASVVRNVAAEQARRGHEVSVIAGWDGAASFDVPGAHVELIRVWQSVPGAGFSGLWSPRLLSRGWPLLRQAQVAHVHLARDLVTLPLARLVPAAGTTLVLQPHGMVTPDRRPKSRLTDLTATRAVLARSNAVLVLTDQEEHDVERLGVRKERRLRVGNGVAVGSPRQPRRDGRLPEVLFLARLHPRKRVLAFAEAAARLTRSGVQARWRVVGPDEGDLAALRRYVQAEGLSEVFAYEGALAPEQVRPRLREADLYVLPAINEVFPMSALEAMAEGTATVLTTSCGISDRLRQSGSAEVCEPDVPSLTEAIARLVQDPAACGALGARAQAFVARELSIVDVVDELDRIYRRVLEEGPVQARSDS